MTRDLIDRTAGPVTQALSDAGISARDLGMVLLVGGSTRMPAVAAKVRELTGKEPSRNLNPTNVWLWALPSREESWAES